MSAPGLTYRDAGVDLQAKDRFTDALLKMVGKTYGPQVVDNPGGFAGYYSLGSAGSLFARRMKEPVLVSGTDGVGTKLLIAIECGRYDTVGIDLVAMSVNDVLVCGAEPIFFLDYMAVGRLDQARELQLLAGIVDGCRQAGCALLGGETATMPGLYQPDHFDLAGFAVGIADRKKILDGRATRPGDQLVGVASAGVHSNGFSLVRRIVADAKLDLRKSYADLPGGTLGEVLLRPTRIYVKPILATLRAHTVQRLVRGMAHITGSGMPGNLPRVLPRGTKAVIRRGSWPVPPVFPFLQGHGGVPDAEMWDVFNMGLGFILVVAPQAAQAVVRRLKKAREQAFVVGEIQAAAPGAEPVVELV